VKFSNPAANGHLGNWTLTGITTIQSGSPVTFLMGDDVALDGTEGPACTDGAGATVSTMCATTPTAPTWSPSSSIQMPSSPPRYAARSLRECWAGSDQRTGLRQHRFLGNQRFQSRESSKLQFRSEFFNAFNQVNFDNPSSRVTSGTFGGYGAPLMGVLSNSL